MIPTDSRRAVGGSLIAVAALAVIAAVSALLLAGGERELGLLVLAALGGGVLSVLAVTRLEAFVLVVVVMRASLDLTKLRGGLSPSLALGLLVVVVAVLAIANRASQPRASSPLGPVPRAAALLVAAAATSTVGAADRSASLMEVARLATAASLPVLLGLVIDRPQRLRRLLAALGASAVVPVVMAAGQALGVGGTSAIGGFERLRGTFLHPNPFAAFCTFLLVLGVALLPAVEGRARRALHIGLPALGLCLLGTYARGAWIAAVVGVVAVALQRRSRTTVGTVIAVLVVVATLAPSTVARFGDLDEGPRASGDASNSLAWRLAYWEDALGLVADNPLTGVGFGMVSERLDEGVPPHNDYLRVVVELGVIGVLAAGVLAFAMVVTARRARRAARTPLDRAIAEGYAGCLIAFGVLAVSSNTLSQVVVLWYLLAIAAAADAVARGVSIGRTPELAPEVRPRRAWRYTDSISSVTVSQS